MCDDDLTDGVGVDEPNVEDKGDEMVVEDDGLEVEVEGDEGPGCEVRKETIERFDGVFGFFAAVLHYVVGANEEVSRISVQVVGTD